MPNGALLPSHRKSAIRVLNEEAEPEPPIKRAGRPRLYDQAVQQDLVTLWEASDRVGGKRLKGKRPVGYHGRLLDGAH